MRLKNKLNRFTFSARYKGGGLLVDIKGEFLWTKYVNTHEKSSFLMNFRGHFW